MLILLSPMTELHAQNHIIYGMKNVPQHNYYNPARQPNCKTYVGFPGLSGIKGNVAFSGLTYNDIFRKHPTKPDSFQLDLDHIQNQLSSKNLIGFDAQVAILEFGFALDKEQYITFSVRNKTEQYFTFSDRLLDIRHGNYNEEGKPIRFEFHEQFINYNEYSIGYSKGFFNNLTIGARFNLLSGNAHINTNKLKIDWETKTGKEDMYPWEWRTDIDIDAAVIAKWDITRDEDGHINGAEIDENAKDSINVTDLIFNKNVGASLDFGVDYRMYDWLRFSAGVKDLGMITWKTNPKQLKEKSTFNFTGIDVSKYVNGLDDFEEELADSLWEDIKDSLLNEFNPVISNHKYTSFLNTKITASAEFSLTKNIDMGVLYYGILIDKKLYSSFSISANANFWKGFSFSLNYSIANNSYSNLGLGLAYKLGPLQMYFATDNIAPALYLWDKEFTKNYMYNTKSVNFQFGINLLFCGAKKDYGLMF